MPLYVVHVMSGGAVDEVARALRGGQRVVAEAVASGFAADERMVWDTDFRARGPARRTRAGARRRQLARPAVPRPGTCMGAPDLLPGRCDSTVSVRDGEPVADLLAGAGERAAVQARPGHRGPLPKPATRRSPRST